MSTLRVMITWPRMLCRVGSESYPRGVINASLVGNELPTLRVMTARVPFLQDIWVN
jgi:hypothetical protein